jgi:hypothetical protein
MIQQTEVPGTTNHMQVDLHMFGHLLGISHHIGNLMSYWILTSNGRVISGTTVQRVANLELGKH